jgi:hypothetical protein
MPRDHAQIADEFVGLLAHDAAPGEVLDDALQQARIAQQLHRLGRSSVADRDRFFLRRKRLFDLLVLQLLQLQQHPAQVAADHFFLDAQLLGGLLREAAALPRRVKVQRVHMEGRLAARRLARYKDIDLQQLVTQILIQATDAVRRSPCCRKMSSPRISTGTSIVGAGAAGLAPAGRRNRLRLGG